MLHLTPNLEALTLSASPFPWRYDNEEFFRLIYTFLPTYRHLTALGLRDVPWDKFCHYFVKGTIRLPQVLSLDIRSEDSHEGAFLTTNMDDGWAFPNLKSLTLRDDIHLPQEELDILLRKCGQTVTEFLELFHRQNGGTSTAWTLGVPSRDQFPHLELYGMKIEPEYKDNYMKDRQREIGKILRPEGIPPSLTLLLYDVIQYGPLRILEPDALADRLEEYMKEWGFRDIVMGMRWKELRADRKVPNPEWMKSPKWTKTEWLDTFFGKIVEKGIKFSDCELVDMSDPEFGWYSRHHA
jgi:hypothetical protein